MATDPTLRISRSLDRFSARRPRRGLPEPQVRIESPRLEFAYGEEHQPFAGASIGKMSTAALVMQLVEAGHWSAESRIADLLPAAELRDLFARRCLDHVGAVTLEHLLAHRAGLPDAFDGPMPGGRTLRGLAVSDPERRWTPPELLDFARGAELVGVPGERFRYSDTGYTLLGRALEEATGQAFHELVHGRIFDRLGMSGSWVIQWSVPRDGGDRSRLAPARLDGIDVSLAPAMSLDWAGGGPVATPAEWVRLMRGLVDGTLIRPESWAFLARPRSRIRFGMRYGASTWTLLTRQLAPFSGRLPVPVGSMGATGTHLWHVPQLDAVIVFNLHAGSELPPSFRPLVAMLRGLVDAEA